MSTKSEKYENIILVFIIKVSHEKIIFLHKDW